MHLNKITLNQFRNYAHREFELSKSVTVVMGNNAVGKTNLMEAINLMATGESFRAKKIEEMVRFGGEVATVKAEFDDGEETVEKEVIMTRGWLAGNKVAKRKYLVNKTPKRKADFLGGFAAVVFRPEDLSLISGSPDGRRALINRIFVQVDKDYQRSLVTYEQALRRRNKLLDAIRDGAATRYSLTFWDGLLIKHGQIISDKRREWVNFINHLWERSELFNKLKLVYDASAISETRLEQYKSEEEILGYTLVGPHKDDLLIKENGERDLGIYGSRGEQRMAVLGLKMGEIYFIEDRIEDKPILLLDDIFSELDEIHSNEVLKVMKGRQVVVTVANESDLKTLGKKIDLIRLE